MLGSLAGLVNSSDSGAAHAGRVSNKSYFRLRGAIVPEKVQREDCGGEVMETFDLGAIEVFHEASLEELQDWMETQKDFLRDLYSKSQNIM